MQAPTFNFQDFDPDLVGYVRIHPRRTFGVYHDVRAAAQAVSRGVADAERQFDLVRLARYVKEWSLDGSPADPVFIADQDGGLMKWILDRSVDHYEEVHRSREERKSDPAAADEGSPGS